MAKANARVNRTMKKLIADEQALVMRQSAEVRLPNNPSIQQVIDRLQLAVSNGIPASAKVGTDTGHFLGGGGFSPLWSLSLRFNEIREAKK